MNARFIAVVVAVGLMDVAVPLRAQTVDDIAQESEKAARASARHAKRAFDLERFSDALAGYEAAYQAMPLPAFLFDMAQCHRYLKHYDKARFLYRRYLAVDPLSEHRPVIEELIAEMTRRIDAESPHPALAVPVSAPNERLLPAEAVHIQSSQVANGAQVRPVYRQWWFWTGVGGLVAWAITAGIVISHESQPTQRTLPAIDGRSGP